MTPVRVQPCRRCGSRADNQGPSVNPDDCSFLAAYVCVIDIRLDLAPASGLVNVSHGDPLRLFAEGLRNETGHRHRRSRLEKLTFIHLAAPPNSLRLAFRKALFVYLPLFDRRLLALPLFLAHASA